MTTTPHPTDTTDPATPGGRMRDTAVIVTGGASGIGRHYCEHLLREGAYVAVADVIDPADLVAELGSRHGAGRVAGIRADVTAESEVESMVATAVESFGRVDVLVNNVGSYPHVDFEDISLDAWHEVMRVNLDSVFLCTKAVLPGMKEQRSGKIVNVATNLVWIGLAGMVHYVTAKAGIVGFTRSLAREVGPYGITVNALAPGAVPPPLDQLDDASMQRLASIVEHQAVKWYQRPVDLVGALLFLSSPESDFVSGQVITVDGGLTNH